MAVLLGGAAVAGANVLETDDPGLTVVALGEGEAGVDKIAPLTERQETKLLDMRALFKRSGNAKNADRVQSGEASFYGAAFAGKPTASGERFDPARMTAAHRTLPLGSTVRVTNEDSGKSIVVKINDRGPFHGNRVIDLSRAAAERLGFVQRGTADVSIDLLKT
ncbi:MAG: septal ring lytic transglycosylase RlpA family protein [Pacificimonas sp.]